MLAAKWLPHHPPDNPDTLATAAYIEDQYWDQMHIAVANGIATAFNGK